MNKLEIYGTLGPSCANEAIIKKMFSLGMTGMRLNLSHCNLWDRKDWLDAFHNATKNLSITADLLIDMKGPELRLPPDDEVIYLPDDSCITFSGLYWPKEIMTNIEVNDILLIDDGKLEFIITKIDGLFIWCNVIRGGHLYGSKSIAIKGKNITGNTLCQTDIENLKEARKYGVTGIMQPFVRSAEDLILLKNTLRELDLEHLKIYAKIENMDGFQHLEELLPYCDYVVIARGDLGNSSGLAHLPIIQKQIEDICKNHHKPYMVVTEMLASMQEKQIPTRAEVSDIFHAIYHGACSIMLTGETASGKYPIQAMEYFIQVAKEAQNYLMGI